MRRAERATKIMGILNKIYPKTPIPLNHRNKFELLISVLLSEQCTDKRVNEITFQLFSSHKRKRTPCEFYDLARETTIQCVNHHN